MPPRRKRHSLSPRKVSAPTLVSEAAGFLTLLGPVGMTNLTTPTGLESRQSHALQIWYIACAVAEASASIDGMPSTRGELDETTIFRSYIAAVSRRDGGRDVFLH